MKKTLFLMMFAATAFMACNKNEGKPTSESVGKVLQQKTWRMTIYFDDGNDKLTNYTGYAFTFSANNSVMAVRNFVTKYGSWKDSMITDTVTKTKVASFYMDFGNEKPFRDLNKNWEIVTKDTKSIHLRQKDKPVNPYDEIYFNLNY
ncbi:hypothetical protein DBR32_09935 [Taibaiella sp. KBW10]|uniref:hypothetical protein n=1 Tax=Taibaiella sp. KBW10 TaxID=2153357 RepID=UPI000F5A2F6F|nr:hypothetical protein [Taibaiella sp. KBW10]RQO31018.1 hypothetical protein DBR32_09935 [Taibaiella sp. KBW10]